VLVLLSGTLLAVVVRQRARAADTISVTGNAQATNSNGIINFSGNNSNVTVSNSTKAFSGYAWSEDLGWIAFGVTDNPEGPVSYNETSGLLSGKAYVFNTGDYLDFNSSPHNSNVRVLDGGSFSGYAWSEDLGWIDFDGVSATGLSFTSPNAPSKVAIYDVSSRADADYALLVRWQEPESFDAGNFQDYLIERSIDGATYASVSSTTSRAYYDTNVLTGITYYYRINTRNTTGAVSPALAVSLEPTGRWTTPPTLVGGPTAETAPTSVTVRWTTNRVGNSYVRIEESNVFVSEQGQSELATEHEVKVVGLRPQKTYTYSIRSRDEDGNELEGDKVSVTTQNSPSVYDVQVTNLTLNSAIINFKSTSIANFTLYYGKTADYGKEVGEQSSQSTTNHSLALTELESGTSYYYRLLGEDPDGNELKSENSFATLPMPEITNFAVEPVKDVAETTLTISWRSNVPTSSSVYWAASGTDKFLEKSSSDLIGDHKIVLTGLTDNTQYSIYASGRDQFGNSAESGKVTYTTPLDTRPPKISNVRAEGSNIGAGSREGESQIIVSWQTDELSTSQVEYGEGVSADYYSNKTAPDQGLTGKHLVVVSGLVPGRPYHLRVNSADGAGNVSLSSDQPAVAGETQKSILQLVLNSLRSVFGWMEKLIM